MKIGLSGLICVFLIGFFSVVLVRVATRDKSNAIENGCYYNNEKVDCRLYVTLEMTNEFLDRVTENGERRKDIDQNSLAKIANEILNKYYPE